MQHQTELLVYLNYFTDIYAMTMTNDEEFCHRREGSVT